MLNYSELRKHYKLYRQEREAADNAMVFAGCGALAIVLVIVCAILN